MNTPTTASPSRFLISIIVLAQFAGTSLWFAGNAVLADIQQSMGLVDLNLGLLTSSVQLGFILGTLVFAFLTIADRFSPSRVFLFCALAGALSNAAILYLANDQFSLLAFRMLTGFFLAGIYPVGMKIAADHFQAGLGKALAWLVGALVVGTAFPHLLRNFTQGLVWEYVLLLTSLLATIGGLLIGWLVPDGPYRRKSKGMDISAFMRVFEHRPFRQAAFGYFGHMWELYTFWALIPFFLEQYQDLNQTSISISLWAFWIIGIGGLSCVIGGYLVSYIGSTRVALYSLALSACCCFLSPWMYQCSPIFFLLFLLFWGMVVIADSPQFSVLVAQRALPEQVGTALTIVTCLGFSLTILSLLLIQQFITWYPTTYVYWLLLIGPLLGLWSFRDQFTKG
ncbi:MAG: MFS transporter [Bacteroidota bacterium]